ncbi:hypothetical protein TNCV_1181731 [Trichonephila clavipes]|nr:hypothetical protein TNCV_1181731 [Trichonephila clavipes]
MNTDKTMVAKGIRWKEFPNSQQRKPVARCEGRFCSAKGSYFVTGGGRTGIRFQSLTRRTCSLGGGGMVKEETAAGEEATCA